MQQAPVSEELGLGTRSHPGSAVAERGPDETAWRPGVPSPQKRSQRLGFQGLQRGKHIREIKEPEVQEEG